MNKILILCTLIFFCITLSGCNYEDNKNASKETSSKISSIISGNESNYESEISTSAQSSIDNENELSSDENTDVDLSKFDLIDKDDSESGIFIGLTTDRSKQYTRFFFNKFTGVRTISKLAKDSTFDYKSSIKRGKLNVVILDSDNKVLKVLNANKSESLQLNFADTEEYILKVVGDEAIKGEVIIQVK